MAQEGLRVADFSDDFRELLALFHGHHVRYMIVGGEAVIFMLRV